MSVPVLVICCNDALHGAVIGDDEELARKRMAELKEEHFERSKGSFKDRDQYETMCYWHVRTVLGGHSPSSIGTLVDDAERYRWLRRQDWDSSPLAVVACLAESVKLGHDCPSRERLDDAIDAAMAAEMAGEDQ